MSEVGTKYYVGDVEIVQSYIGENEVLINPFNFVEGEYAVRSDEYGQYIVFASPGANLDSQALSQLGMTYGWSDVSGVINGSGTNLTVLSSSIHLYSTSSSEYFAEYSGSTYEGPDAFISGGVIYGRSLLESTSSVFDFKDFNFTIESYIYRFGTLNTTIAQKKVPGVTQETNFDFFIATIGGNEQLVFEFPGGETISANINGLIATGSWYHTAVVRSGNNFYLYLDGNRVASLGRSGAFSVVTTPFRAFGGRYSTAPAQEAVLFSDYRVYNGAAKYTGSTYTLPESILYQT
jgi:hypothetical protein